MTIKLVPDTVILGVSDTRTIAIIGPYQSMTFSGDTSIAGATLNNDTASITLTGAKLGYYALTATTETGDTAKVYVTVATDDQVEASYSDITVTDNLPDSEFINDTSAPEANEDQQAPTDETLTQDEQDTINQQLEALELLFPLPADSEFVYGRDQDRGIQGILSSDLGNLLVEQVVLPITPAVTENVQNQGGGYGQHWLGNNFGARTISINVSGMCEDETEYRQTIENMSNALINLGQTEHSITFGQYPDRTWFGHFTTMSGPAWINQGSWDFKTTLTFVASDPKAYLETEQVEVVANPTIITPSGNAESYPIISYVFKDDVKQFGYSSSQGGEVAVGFSDEQLVSDLRPRVYLNECSDLAQWHQVTDGSKLNGWGPTGAINPDAQFGIGASKQTLRVKQYYDKKNKNYDFGVGSWTGGLLMTDTFNTKIPSGKASWQMDIRGYHIKHYNRAISSLEFYLISDKGERLARFGVADRKEGNWPRTFVKFGSRAYKEDANMKLGMGFDGSGNTSDLWKSHNNGKNQTVTISNATEKATANLDRVVTTTETNTWYSGDIGSQAKVYWGSKTVNVTKKKITYFTPLDDNGKPTGKQQSNTQVLQSTSNKSAVALNKVVKKKVGKRYINQNDSYSLHSTRKVVTNTTVWTNDTHKTTINKTENFDRAWYKKNGKVIGYWKLVGHKRTENVDNHASGRASTVNITTNYNLTDLNNTSALTKFWGIWHLEYHDQQLKVKLSQFNGDNGLEQGAVVFEKTFKTPKDMPVAQIGVYMSKIPIHEDKIGAGGYPIAEYEMTEEAVTEVSVFKDLSPADANPTRIIAHKGDTAIIDGETRNVYINGKLANVLESAFSTYPALKGGRSDEITIVPDRSKADAKITWRPSTR